MSGGPSHARNLVNAARTVLSSGETMLGRKLLARVLALDSNDREALWLEGEASRVMGDLAAARAAYERLLTLEAGHAEAACALALVTDEAAQAAWRAGEAARAEGELEAALAAYREATARNPADGLAAYAMALVGDQPLPPPPPPAARPVPYVYIKGFLPAERRDEVLELTIRNAKHFGPALLNAEGTYDESLRRAEFISLFTQGDIGRWFLPLVAEVLPDLTAQLGAGALSPTEAELQMTAYHDGDYFTAHHDAEAAEEGAPRRRVSFVYYYHWAPKRFSGGDLLLYDTTRYDHRGLTRLVAADNTIVFFPSDALHEVTPVRCEDGEFKSGRFTLNGWIHAI